LTDPRARGSRSQISPYGVHLPLEPVSIQAAAMFSSSAQAIIHYLALCHTIYNFPFQFNPHQMPPRRHWIRHGRNLHNHIRRRPHPFRALWGRRRLHDLSGHPRRPGVEPCTAARALGGPPGLPTRRSPLSSSASAISSLTPVHLFNAQPHSVTVPSSGCDG
jgi:hypothetical protein